MAARSQENAEIRKEQNAMPHTEVGAYSIVGIGSSIS